MFLTVIKVSQKQRYDEDEDESSLHQVFDKIVILYSPMLDRTFCCFYFL